MRLRFPEIERAATYNPRFALGQLSEEALKGGSKMNGKTSVKKELIACAI
jgi:hypothetical protein